MNYTEPLGAINGGFILALMLTLHMAYHEFVRVPRMNSQVTAEAETPADLLISEGE